MGFFDGVPDAFEDQMVAYQAAVAQHGGSSGAGRVEGVDVSPEAWAIYARLHPEDAAVLQRERSLAELDPKVRDELEAVAAAVRAGTVGTQRPDGRTDGPILHMENREAFERLYPEEAERYDDLQFVAGIDPRTRAELDAVAAAVRGGTVGTQRPDGRTDGPILHMENREAFERLYPEEAERYDDLQFVAGIDPRTRAELDAVAAAVRGGTVGTQRPDGRTDGPILHMENREAFERLYPEEAERYDDLQFVAGIDPRTRAELDAVAAAVRGGTVGTQRPDGRTDGPILHMENREAFERLYPEEAERYDDLQFVAGIDPRTRTELDAFAAAVREGTVGTQSPDGRTTGPVVSMENREAFERLYPEEAAQWRAGAGDPLSTADPRIAEEVRQLEAQRMPGAAAPPAPAPPPAPPADGSGRAGPAADVSDIDPARAAWAAEFAERVRSGEFAEGQGGVGFKAEAREAFDRLYPEESALLDAQLGMRAAAAEAALAADEQEVGAGSPPVAAVPVAAAPAEAATMAPPEALDALGLPVPAAAPAAAAAMVPPEQLDVMGVEVHLAPPPMTPTEGVVPLEAATMVPPVALTATEVEAGAVVVEEVPEMATLDNGFDLELASAVAPLEPVETDAAEAPAYEDGIG